jgi:hypothetical protein
MHRCSNSSVQKVPWRLMVVPSNSTALSKPPMSMTALTIYHAERTVFVVEAKCFILGQSQGDFILTISTSHFSASRSVFLCCYLPYFSLDL